MPKLRYEHIYLTSVSKMRVDLAAQVSYKYFQVQVFSFIISKTSFSVLHICHFRYSAAQYPKL